MCIYKAKKFSEKIATIVVAVATIVVDQIATIVIAIARIVVFCDNCDWCCDNCGLIATIVNIVTIVITSGPHNQASDSWLFKSFFCSLSI